MTHSVILRLVLAVLLTSITSMSTATASAPGSISVQVIVDGEDRSGGSFRIVVLPAEFPQPVYLEVVEEFTKQTERHRAHFDGLELGSYFVAVLIPDREMKAPTPASVEVVAPQWVQNTSGVTRGYWPAYKVELTEDRPNATVTFVRVGYPPLPEGFVIPSTGGGENTQSPIAPPDTGDGGVR